MSDNVLDALRREPPDLATARAWAWRCLKCSVCNHVDVHSLGDAISSPICPSGQLFAYHAYTPAGRIELLRALLDGELDALSGQEHERLEHIAYTCLLCGGCETVCKRETHPLLLARTLREEVRHRSAPGPAAVLACRIRETGHIYGSSSVAEQPADARLKDPLPSLHRNNAARQEITDELAAIAGSKWVSDDLPIRAAYARDASLAAKCLPALVVLPANTDEVARVLSAASHRGIPVTVRSTGLNLEGLTIPRTGGILMDLARMNRILEIDPRGMSVTVQPCATVGQVQAAAEPLGLRAAQPGAPSSASLMGNTLLLGLSITSVAYGTGADRIRALTLVLPTGEVLALGSKVSGAPPLAYDLTRLPRCGNGRFGICTEMTIDLFPMDGLWRMGVAIYAGDQPLPSLSPLRKIARASLTTYLSLFNRSTIADQLATTDYQAEELEQSLPPFFLVYGLRGYAEAEIDAREAEIERILRGTDWTLLPSDMVGEMFREFTGGSPALTRMGGEVCRWGRGSETIRWTKTWMHVDRIPAVYSRLHEAILDEMSTDKPARTGLYIQPYELGRSALLEIDYFPLLSNPREREKALRASRAFAAESAALGLTGGITAHRKKGSVYATLEEALKATLDPAGILNPRADESDYEPDICG